MGGFIVQERDNGLDYNNVNTENLSHELFASFLQHIYFRPENVSLCVRCGTLCCKEGTAEASGHERLGLTLSTLYASDLCWAHSCQQS